MNFFGKPEPSEHPPYMGSYINLVTADHLPDALEQSLQHTLALFTALPEQKWEYRYAPGKWTCKEILGHLVDAERVFIYRAVCFARGEEQPQPGFEEDDYVKMGAFNKRTPQSLIEEHTFTRRSTIAFFRDLEPEALVRQGIANGKPISVRAIGYAIAGHGLHHAGVIRERYL